MSDGKAITVDFSEPIYTDPLTGKKMSRIYQVTGNGNQVREVSFEEYLNRRKVPPPVFAAASLDVDYSDPCRWVVDPGVICISEERFELSNHGQYWTGWGRQSEDIICTTGLSSCPESRQLSITKSFATTVGVSGKVLEEITAKIDFTITYSATDTYTYGFTLNGGQRGYIAHSSHLNSFSGKQSWWWGTGYPLSLYAEQDVSGASPIVINNVLEGAWTFIFN